MWAPQNTSQKVCKRGKVQHLQPVRCQRGKSRPAPTAARKKLNCFELAVLMKGDSDECVNIFITSELLSSGQPEVNITCTELCSVLLTRPAHISVMDLFAVVRDFWCFTTTYFFYCWVTFLGMKLATNRREREASYIRSRLLITLLITPHKLDLCEV